MGCSVQVRACLAGVTALSVEAVDAAAAAAAGSAVVKCSCQTVDCCVVSMTFDLPFEPVQKRWWFPWVFVWCSFALNLKLMTLNCYCDTVHVNAA
jgi:hypothetical protein